MDKAEAAWNMAWHGTERTDYSPAYARAVAAASRATMHNDPKHVIKAAFLAAYREA